MSRTISNESFKIIGAPRKFDAVRGATIATVMAKHIETGDSVVLKIVLLPKESYKNEWFEINHRRRLDEFMDLQPTDILIGDGYMVLEGGFKSEYTGRYYPERLAFDLMRITDVRGSEI